MNRKVLFYNLFVKKDKKAYNSDLVSLINHIKSKPLDLREKVVNEYNFKIHEVYDEGNNLFAITFSKQRNDKPYTEEEEKLKELDDDIYETTTIIYKPSIHLIMIDYIHNGPSARTFMQYLNSFLKDDSDIEVCIRQVKSADQLRLIANADNIKEIHIEYDIVDDDYSSLFKGNYRDQSIMEQTAEVNAKFSEEFDSKIADLILRKGRFRDPLNMGKALGLLYHLDTDSEIIRSVKVKVKKGFKEEKYDLKHNQQLYRIVNIRTNTYISIKNELLQSFTSDFYKDDKLNLKEEYKKITNRVKNKIDEKEWEENFIEE